MDYDKVECQICGNVYGAVTPPHIKKHGWTVAQYTKKFGKGSTRSQKHKDNAIAGGKRNKGNKHTDATKDKIRALNLKRGQGYKDKVSASVSKLWENEDYRRNMSEAHMGHVQSPEQIKKKADSMKAFYKTDEGIKVRGKLSRVATQSVLDGKIGYNKSVPRLYEDRKNQCHQFKSISEAAVAIHLDVQGVDWQYEPYSMTYRLQDGVERNYTPDFVTDSQIIEVKGFCRQVDREKVQSVQEHWPKVPIVIWDAKIVRSLGTWKLAESADAEGRIFFSLFGTHLSSSL
tara:strand:- start:330 stop:1193 length:864 start_codon:yes stop_codon:yes gene_type:complete